MPLFPEVLPSARQLLSFLLWIQYSLQDLVITDIGLLKLVVEVLLLLLFLRVLALLLLVAGLLAVFGLLYIYCLFVALHEHGLVVYVL